MIYYTAAVTLVECGSDWNNVTGILAKSNISFAEKLKKEALVIPTPAILNISLGWLHTIGFTYSLKIYQTYTEIPHIIIFGSKYADISAFCGHGIPTALMASTFKVIIYPGGAQPWG